MIPFFLKPPLQPMRDWVIRELLTQKGATPKLLTEKHRHSYVSYNYNEHKPSDNHYNMQFVKEGSLSTIKQSNKEICKFQCIDFFCSKCNRHIANQTLHESMLRKCPKSTRPSKLFNMRLCSGFLTPKNLHMSLQSRMFFSDPSLTNSRLEDCTKGLSFIMSSYITIGQFTFYLYKLSA